MDVPISTGNLNDGLIAYAGGKMITLKVPYPTGFYAKGLDGRIAELPFLAKADVCMQEILRAHHHGTDEPGAETQSR